MICQAFEPGTQKATLCGVCGTHWNHHPLTAKSALMSCGDQRKISRLVEGCKAENSVAAVCTQYIPVGDWEPGVAAPDCTCGRARNTHPAKQVMEGIRKWRENRGIERGSKTKAKPPCGQFYGSIARPGLCQVCDQKWISHARPNRGLVIEAFTSLHKDWCKCILMNGDVECSCLDDHEKQVKLNELGNGTLSKMSCKHFKPKSIGVATCECGEPFYQHSKESCDGHTKFIEWRSAHMSNKELLVFFRALPGATRQERINSLKMSLSDPYYTFPKDLIFPDTTGRAALLDALTGSHHIQSPADLEKAARRDLNVVDAQVIHAEDLPLNDEEERKYLCYSCGEQESTVPGSVCVSCSEYYTAGGNQIADGPARRSNDKGGS